LSWGVVTDEQWDAIKRYVPGRERLRTIEMIAPHRPLRKNITRDGRSLRRYRRRWHVERLFAWLMRFRRLVSRYEHKTGNFLALTKLACLAILLRRV
jgi:transposase